MDENEGWFADVGDGLKPDQWQPYVQITGCCLPLDVMFDSKTSCDDFIRTKLVGLKHLDD